MGEGPRFEVEEKATIETASASPAEFETEEALNVKCAEADFKSSTSLTESTSISVEPSYSSCTISKLPIASVSANGCEQRYEVTTAITESGDWNGFMAIDCPAGESIEISIPSVGCTIELKPHTPAEITTYENLIEGQVRTTTEWVLASSQNANCPGGESNSWARYSKATVFSGVN